MYLLVDPHRFPVGDEGIKDGAILLDWLEPNAAVQISPLFLIANADNVKYVDVGWGSDAVVAMFSNRPPQELLANLQELSKPRKESEGMLGFFWPSILAHLLNSQAKIGSQLTDLASTVLIESPEDPQQWRLFGRDLLATTLSEIGLAHGPRTSVSYDDPE